MKKSTIATLITCHNRKSKTIGCLQALFDQQELGKQYDIKVFLVEDGSTDGTAEAVKEMFPEVKIIFGDGSLYWNRGMHLAWAEAAKEDFEYYLWLNDDTTLFADALSGLYESAVETKGKSIICGTTCSATEQSATYGGRSKTKGLIVPNGRLQECEYFNGNCVLIPGYVYKITGNLDYAFNHGIGDWDYGLRAAKAGIKSLVAPAFIGTCEKHDIIAKWCSPTVRLKDRIKAFKTPLGLNPSQYFIFDRRHNGLFSAVIHYVTIHLRVLFPFFWIPKSQALVKKNLVDASVPQTDH